MSCLTPEDLVEQAFVGSALAEDHPTVRHLRTCPSCIGTVHALRETASAFRPKSRPEGAPATACLSDDELAAVAEGLGGEDRGRWLVHLTACDECRSRLTGLMRLLGDVEVAGELRRLDRVSPGAAVRRLRLPYVAAAATFAAAVVGRVLLWPGTSPVRLALDEGTPPPHRESAITTTVAPRIVGPVGPASEVDLLTWTSVPHADRYRIRVFDQEGNLRWDTHTSDTTVAIPAQLRADTATVYLWKVDARTGWDRWVASEWWELEIRSQARPR